MDVRIALGGRSRCVAAQNLNARDGPNHVGMVLGPCEGFVVSEMDMVLVVVTTCDQHGRATLPVPTCIP